MNRARFSLLLFMTIFVCLLNTPLFSQSMEKNMEATDESQIKMLYNEMCRAMISKDMEEMERIHTDIQTKGDFYGLQKRLCVRADG